MIYLDMDGVLADFDAALRSRGIENRTSFIHKDRSTWTQEDIDLDQKVLECMREPGWFANLPLMEGARELWDFCTPFKPVVLTARPKAPDRAKIVTDEKRSWITKQFGDVPDDQFICCLREEKSDFIGHTNHVHQILVDDLEANCLEWGEAGGIGIVHKSAEMTIYQLKMLLNV